MTSNPVLCPKCNSRMELRTARRGRNAGGNFYGCSRFPTCRGTRDYTESKPSQFSERKSKSTSRARHPVANDGQAAGNDANASIMKDDIRKKFLQLIKYYRECIQIENLSDISFLISNQSEEFLQCPSDVEWLSSGKESFEIKSDTEDIGGFARRARWKRRSLSYYYSYPIFVKKVNRRDTGKQSVMILPLLTFPVDCDKNSDRILIKRNDIYRPQVNTAVLKAIDLAPRAEQRRLFMRALIENWREDADIQDNFKKVIQFLTEEFGKSNFFDPNLEDLGSVKIDLNTVEDGFYACGILFATQGSNYTYGLEEELEEIQKQLEDGRITSAPAIEALIARQKNDVGDTGQQKTRLIEIAQLNDEQREAVLSSLRDDLTIVTGPPGTGKSQVVLNIIANAVANNESVLFGSKNHQAVDVVLQRLDEIQEQPIALKFGQNAKESIFVDRLLSAVDNAGSYDSAMLKADKSGYFESLTSLRDQENKIWKDVHHSYDIRNRIDKLDLQMEILEKDLDAALVVILKTDDALSLKKIVLKSIENYIKELESGQLSFISLFLDFFSYTLERRVQKKIISLLKGAATDGVYVNYFNELFKKNDSLLTCCKLFCSAVRWQILRDSLLKLYNEPSAKAAHLIEQGRLLDAAEKQRCELSPRFLDVFMVERLKTLGHDIREDIADYKTTVRRIENDQIGGQFVKDLREQKKNLFKTVVNVFPAIAVTNLSVRHAVPLTPGLIDLVVIDEASQCDIASAIPMLVRAKRAVIIGDEKQLTHVSNISKVDDQQIQARCNLSDTSDQRYLYSEYSLFDLAKSTVSMSGHYVSLRDHFRSRAEIIAFSNKAFYGDRLRVWTDYRQLKQTGTVEGICWHDVNGQVVRPSGGSAYNLEEANKVVDLLTSLLARLLEIEASVGIVTPFRAQANKIRDLVMKKIPIDSMEALDLKIDTAHGYQGDERDIMIFSPVVSRGIQDRTLGFLRHTQNLFNVAITRPRAELHVVGDRMACARSGVDHLERFAHFVGKSVKIDRIDRKKFKTPFDSDWEKMFYEKLLERGIRATPQIAIHQYKLDLAIEDHNPPINIEIDGEAYHREITGDRRAADIKRDNRLCLLGWIVKRFWVYELKYDLERCLNEVTQLVCGDTQG